MEQSKLTPEKLIALGFEREGTTFSKDQHTLTLYKNGNATVAGMIFRPSERRGPLTEERLKAFWFGAYNIRL